MMNCRSVPPSAWEHARQALVFYFSRRQNRSNAEDLAQETLKVLWEREDFQFEREEDFLKVCYGFASRIQMADWRRKAQRSGDEDESVAVARGPAMQGLRDAEVAVYLDEVLRLGKAELREVDWKLIEKSAILERDPAAAEPDPVVANKTRVRLYRARRKLVDITGWRKGRE